MNVKSGMKMFDDADAEVLAVIESALHVLVLVLGQSELQTRLSPWGKVGGSELICDARFAVPASHRSEVWRNGHRCHFVALPRKRNVHAAFGEWSNVRR